MIFFTLKQIIYSVPEHSMRSWASIVGAKTNPPSTQTVVRAVAAAAATPREDDIFTLKTTKITKGRVGGGGQPALALASTVAPATEPISEKQQSTESNASTESIASTSAPLYQCISPSEHHWPSHKTLIRPGAPTVAPIFKNETEKREWEDKEYQENCNYSNEIHHQEMEKWREEKRWHNVPNMTSMTKEEEAAGFVNLKVYKSQFTLDQERRMVERCPGFVPPSDYGYLVPWNSTKKSDMFWDFVGRLFYNRADELCRCKTVEDFEKVYNEAAQLQWLDWKWKIHQEVPAKDALWTMSIKANMWPGKTFAPRPDDDVCRGLSGFVKKTTKYEVRGVKRGETGICSVKDIKTLGKKAPIRWHVSPTYLKNMKRFQFIYEENPNAMYYDSDEECFYDRRPVFSDDD